MTIKRDIEKLKQSQTPDSASDDLLRLLLDLVAKRDALFWLRRTPIRSDLAGLKNLPAIIERRESYLDRSYGSEAKASGAGDWKKSHYLRRQLIDFGWAEATYAKGQITSLFVSELGDTVAQKAIHGDDVFPIRTRAAFELLQRNPGMYFLTGPWVSESKLFGRELFGDPHDWVHLTELLLPLLVRNLVRSHQDTAGRIFYGFVSAELPELIEVNQPIVDWAQDHYIIGFNGELSTLDSLVYEGHELTISLPATSFGNCLCSEENGPKLEHGELALIMKNYKENPKQNFHQLLALAKKELKDDAKNP